jgi:serine/threonine-protein kinase RsbT
MARTKSDVNVRGASATSCRVANETDLLLVRQMLRARARQVGLDLADETAVVTAGSELARNILRYANNDGGGGEMQVEIFARDRHQGVRAVFADHGPGISDVARAMQDGYSSSGNLGRGLPGARRLVDDFSIDSAVGKGTRVTIVKWAR